MVQGVDQVALGRVEVLEFDQRRKRREVAFAGADAA